MHKKRTQRIALVAVVAIAFFAVACGGEEVDDRDPQELYDAAMNNPPADLSIINIPETARRPTVDAVYQGTDVVAATDAIEAELAASGWTIITASQDPPRGYIVGERGDDDIQVELLAGDMLMSVNITFAAPGEGL